MNRSLNRAAVFGGVRIPSRPNNTAYADTRAISMRGSAKRRLRGISGATRRRSSSTRAGRRVR
jgi:hypothetical protein